MCRFYSFLLIFSFTFLFNSNALATSCAIPGISTGFSFIDVPVHNVITSFEINQDGHSATFIGGLVKQFSYPDNSVYQSWVILPAGNTTKGVSNGEAIIKMNPVGDSLFVSAEVGLDVNGRVQVIGEDSSVIREVLLIPEDSLIISTSRFDGEPLISEIKIIIDGGSTETQVTFFSYSNSAFDDCGSGSAFFSGFYLMLPIIIFLMRKLFNQK